MKKNVLKYIFLNKAFLLILINSTLNYQFANFAVKNNTGGLTEQLWLIIDAYLL